MNKETMKSDLGGVLHQEVTDSLPDGAEEKVDDHFRQLAEEKGVRLRNAIPEPVSGRDPENRVMVQGFEWYLPNDGEHWNRLRDLAGELKAIGAGSVWTPPCCKATGTNDVGYGVYDLWDVGEFDQKGAVRTKYGTREQFCAMIDALHEAGIRVYIDAVLNHKAGADEAELFAAVRVNPDNRNEQISEPHDIKGWTRFIFPGRKGKYSGFEWNFSHFTAVDYDDMRHEGGIFRILGDNKGFAPNVDGEKGNFDYLMFADIDYRNRDVMEETLRWGEWFVNTFPVDGMRLDAVKHINSSFVSVFLRQTRLSAGRPLYFVGEYWNADENRLMEYIDDTDDQMALFDVALHFNFKRAADEGGDFDLRGIYGGTLIEKSAWGTVTFVDNHDSQQGQALESWVSLPFKLLAYALILLRREGYPCLFWGDYYGIAGGPGAWEGLKPQLDPMLEARLKYAYGDQKDYFDHPDCIGWLRLGDAGHEGSGLAVLISNRGEGRKRMAFGPLNAGTTWRDVMGGRQERITLDEQGEGEFVCNENFPAVYIRA